MKKQIYFINFDERPLVAKKGYIKNIDRIDKRNPDSVMSVEHNGQKLKIKNINIYDEKLEALERINEYYTIKKFKATHGHQCAYCGTFITNQEDLTVDHIISKDKGGKTEEKNLCIACKKCNRDKTNEDPFVFINKEYKVQINKEKGNRKKIARSINLKKDNVEYIAKKDSRTWNLKLFLDRNPRQLAQEIGC